MKKQTPAPIRFRRKPLITALEPRILLDGAAVATTAEMTTDVAFQDEVVHTESADQSVHFAAPAPTGSEPGSRREVAFVDTSVEGYETLVDGLGDNVDVILIEGSGNGLEQMVTALQGKTGIDAIHLFSHGDVGELRLGNLTLNGENLEANSELLSTLGESLTENGDLMLYGCYVGADSEGQSFIDSVAELTQADVAASEDLTGAAEKGGDWELEAESGVVEAEELAVAGFKGVLAPTISGLDDMTYTEGDGTVTIDGDVTISGSTDYTGGYLEFAIDSATTAESIGFITDSSPSTVSGEVSIVGSTVYRGDGTNASVIGSVDPVKNGLNGQPLRINFSNAFENGDFQDGVAGSTTITGWTSVLESVRLDGVDQIAGQNTPVDTTYEQENLTDAQGDNGGVAIKDDTTPGAGQVFVKSAILAGEGDSGPGDLAIKLNTGAASIEEGYGVIRGPYVYSDGTVSLQADDTVEFDWKAVAGGDAYDAYGYIIDVNTGDTITILDSTGNDSGDGAATPWATERVTIQPGQEGVYRFVFVAGSYDLTGLRYVGGELLIDNVQVTQANPPGPVGDATITAITQKVTYTNTAVDHNTLTRDLTVSVQDKSGATGSDSSQIFLTEENNAPSFSGDATLSSVNEDTTSPAGATVSSLFDGLFTDVDAQFDPKDTLAGIVITADSSAPSQGEWQYSTDGSNWFSIGTVASTSGLLISLDASLRFVPAADYSGTPGSLSVHAVDSSDGAITFTNGADRQTFDTTVVGVTGGDTAVSSGAVNLNTSITAVNDAPVMDAPLGGTLVDTAADDIFSDLAGALTASDTDSPSLNYGIQGGSDNGSYVTLTGTYGTLQVTKSTGAYTFTPNHGSINGLNTTETQSFTVTVSDGALTSTQTLEFTLEGANDNPAFVVDNSDTQVSVFSMPNLNGNDSFPNEDNENANLASIIQWVINEGGDYSLDTSIRNFTDADFAAKLAASGFFFMTDMEQFTSSFDPLSETYLPTSSANAINSWVNDGGVILMTGTAGTEDVEFLNRVFAWDLTSQSGSNWSINTANVAGTPFEGGPASLDDPSATDSIGAGSVDGFKALYGTSSNAAVAEIGFGKGRVLFLGYDFYDSGISGTGFTTTATQYGTDVADGASNTNDWVREIIPRALQYSAQLSADTQFTESNNPLDGMGSFWVSDVDQPDSVTVSVSDVVAEQRNSDGAPITSSASQPSNAELMAMLDLGSQPVIDGSSTSGEVNWTFNSNTETFNYLAAGESLVLTYEITADDGNDGTATRTLVITVNGVNDAPVALGGTETVAENGVFTGSANASDVDGTVDSFELVSSVSSGSLTFDPTNGSYSFDPGTAFDDLAEGEVRPVTFTYRALDNTGAASEVVTVTLNVTGSNDVPVVSASIGTTSENGSLSSSVPVATDVDGTIAGYQLVNDVASGNLAFNSDGSYTFETGTDFDDLAVGESRPVAFTYTATDNDGGVSAPGTVTFTITGTNDAPTISVEAAEGITELDGDSSAQDLSDTGVVSFGDLDTTDLVDITFVSDNNIAWSGGTIDAGLAAALVGGLTIPTTTDAAAPGNVNWSYNVADANLDFLAAGETITFSYTVTATDSQNAPVTDTLSFTITGTNDAPTLSVEAAEAISEVGGDSSAQDLSDTGVVSFGDLDTTDLVDITFASDNNIAWSGGTIDAGLAAALVGGLTIPTTTDAAAPGNVNWSYSVADANLDFLAAGEIITFSYTVTATDSQNATVTDTLSFTITGTNDEPTLSVEAAEAITEVDGDSSTQDLSDTGVVSFGDLDTTDVVDITFVSDGNIAWSGGTIDTGLATALVGGLTIPTTTDAAAPGSVNWSFNVADANLDFLAAGETITFSYTVTATDSQNATSTDTLSFTITGTNDAPTLSVESAEAITEVDGDSSAQDLSDTGVVSFGDLDTTDLVDITFASDNNIAWSGGTIDTGLATALVGGLTIPTTTDAAAPGSVNWSYSVADVNLDFLAAGETITFSYTVTATDSQSATVTDTLNFTITGTNDAPTVSVEAAEAFTEVDGDSSAQDLSDTGLVSFGDLDTTDVVDITFASDNNIAWSGGTIDAGLAAALVGGLTIPTTTDAAAPGTVNWSYNVADANLDFLVAGETITFSYTITATDTQGATATDTLSFIITGSNDAPTISVEAPEAITEAGDSSSQGLSDSGEVSYNDLNANDVIDITYTSNGDIEWSGGNLNAGLASSLVDGFSIPTTIDAAASGSVDWNYNVAAVNLDFLAEGETITFSYTVTATDREGATATDSLTFTITGTNDAPTVSVEAADVITEVQGDSSAQVLSDSGRVSYGDLDVNDRVNISFVSNRDISWSGGDLDSAVETSLINGFSIPDTIDSAASGAVNWNYSVDNVDLDFLAEGETITFSYTVTATDREGATATDTLSFTIIGSNDVPVLSISTVESFTEADNAAQQSLVQSGTVDFADADLNDTITIDFVSNNDITWKRADDSVVAPLPEQLVYSLLNGFTTGGGNLSHEGQIDWAFSAENLDLDFLNAGDSITLSYTVTVQDSEGVAVSDVVVITLEGTNDAPEMTARQLSDDETTVLQGDDFDLSVSSLFSDKDSTLSGEKLYFDISGLPQGLAYDAATGVISGKPTQSGPFTINVMASDATGATLTRSFSMTVVAVVAPDDGGSSAGVRDSLPEAPQNDVASVGDGNDGGEGGLPQGLIDNNGSSDPTDGSGFLPTSGTSFGNGTGSDTSAGFDNRDDGGNENAAETAGEERGLSEGGEQSTQLTEASRDDLGAESSEAVGNETVILSETGALVVQTQMPDGNTTLKATVDVNVDASGQVVFTDVQQEAFSTVSLTVASIDQTADNQVTIDIQDTSSTASTQQYSGSLASGESLPSWIQLDPATGTVVIDNPPVGQSEVIIRIQAMGSDGHLRVLELKLDLEELLKRQAANVDQPDEAADDSLSTSFVPLNDQLETELVAREQYGDRLLAMLHSV